MVLDECIEYPASLERARGAAVRTLAWARRSRIAIDRKTAERQQSRGRCSFPSVQGSTYPELRRENADQLVELAFPGYAIGGLAVGEPHELTCEVSAGLVQLPGCRRIGPRRYPDGRGQSPSNWRTSYAPAWT